MLSKAQIAKRAAMKKFGDVAVIRSFGPVGALLALDWSIHVGDPSLPVDVTEQVLNFDPEGCFGRTARAAAVLTRHFPDVVVQYAEVWEDYLRNTLLVHRDREIETFSQELLSYEEPHAVVLINGHQFDPLSTVMEQEIIHPVVGAFPLWEGLASAWEVASASRHPEPQGQLDMLEQAEKLCPGTTLVAENMIQPLMELDREDEAIALLADVVKNRRRTARGLYLLRLFTGSSAYEDELRAIYPATVIRLIEEEVASASAQ